MSRRRVTCLGLLFLFLFAVPASLAEPTPSITIKSLPEDAEIFLNDQPTGLKTPAVVRVAPQTYILTLKHVGCKEYRTNLDLNRDTGGVFVRLSSIKSRFSFIRQFKVGIQPKDLVFSPDGKFLIISLLADKGPQVYNMATGDLRQILLTSYSKNPSIVMGIFNADGSELWCNQMNEQGRTYVFDTKDYAVKKIIPTSGNWSKVGEFSPDGRLYYVSNWLSNDISVLDTVNYRFVRKIKTSGKSPRGIGLSEDGKHLYAVFFDSGEIMKFNLSNGGKVEARVKTGGANGRWQFDRQRQLAYITNMSLDKIFCYDLQTDKLRGEIKAWEKPNNIRLSLDRRYLFVTNRGPNNTKSYLYRSPVDGRVQVFDAEDKYRLVEDLLVGNQPTGLAVSPDGKILAVSNFMDNTVELYLIEL